MILWLFKEYGLFVIAMTAFLVLRAHYSKGLAWKQAFRDAGEGGVFLVWNPLTAYVLLIIISSALGVVLY